MNDPITPQSAAQTPGNTLTFWSRFRTTFGPAAVGLVGGTLTVGIAYPMFAPILRACGQTYAKFPSLQAPRMVGDHTLSNAVVVPLIILAVVAPFVMGMVTARLVRPKDWWEAASAGLTTGATASAAAYALWIGWAMTLATVLVPSVSDMTLFAHATRTPAEATAHPTDVLTEPYPDLKATPANERGDLFFPKIVAGQVVGSASGVWLGVVMSVAAVGIPGLCGTLAGAWLLRRGGSRWSVLFSYAEITVATAVPLCLLLFAAASAGLPVEWRMPHLPWPRFAALAAVSVVVVAGGVTGWSWPLRVVAAFAWAMALFGMGFRDQTSVALIGTGIHEYVWKPTTYAALLGYGGLAVLVVRQLVVRRRLAPVSPQPAW